MKTEVARASGKRTTVKSSLMNRRASSNLMCHAHMTVTIGCIDVVMTVTISLYGLGELISSVKYKLLVHQNISHSDVSSNKRISSVVLKMPDT